MEEHSKNIDISKIWVTYEVGNNNRSKRPVCLKSIFPHLEDASYENLAYAPYNLLKEAFLYTTMKQLKINLLESHMYDGDLENLTIDDFRIEFRRGIPTGKKVEFDFMQPIEVLEDNMEEELSISKELFGYSEEDKLNWLDSFKLEIDMLPLEQVESINMLNLKKALIERDFSELEQVLKTEFKEKDLVYKTVKKLVRKKAPIVEDSEDIAA